VEGEYSAASVERFEKALSVAEAFDAWRSLDRQLEKLGPSAVSPETISRAWQDLLQAHEEWSLSR